MVMRLKDVGHYQPMFETKEGDVCLEQLEVKPRQCLLGEFLYKGDFAVLCGAEGSGKSVLAFQLADALSRGQTVEGFANDCGPQKVMFLDFENKHERFARRYSESGLNKYPLSSNLLRTTFSSKFTEYVGLRNEFHVEMNRRVPGRQPEVLIVNNLEVAKCFVSEPFLISLLKEYQARLNLTVILVCSINPGKAPLHLWRVGRSLREISDSVFAIGKSKQGKNIRYLKQLKSSDGEAVYDENELPEFTIEQKGNFTGFYHKGFGLEQEHLTGPPVGLDLEIVELKSRQPELTYKEIAEKLETHKTRVMRALEKYGSSFGYAQDDIPFGYAQGDSHRTPINKPHDRSGARGVMLSRVETCSTKSGQTVDTLVTNNFENGLGRWGNFADENPTTDALSFSNPLLQLGGEKEKSSPCPLPSPADPAQGGMPNAEPNNKAVTHLPVNPFRNKAESLDRPTDRGVANEGKDGHGSAILCHAEAEGRPEARQRIVGTDGENPSAKSEHGLNGLVDFTEEAKSGQTVDAVVTNNFEHGLGRLGDFVGENSTTDALSFSNPLLQLGSEKEKSSPCPLPSPADPTQGGMPNAEPNNKVATHLPVNPFRGKVEPLDQPFDRGVANEGKDGHGSAILCHAEAEGRLEARQRIVGTDGENPSAKSEHGLNGLVDFTEGAKSGQTVGAVVTNNFDHGLSRLGDFADKNSTTDALSFSNPLLQPGGEKEKSSPYPLPSPADPTQGGIPNAEPNNKVAPHLPVKPFRGKVEPLNQPSDRGLNKEPFSQISDPEVKKDLKTLDALITSYCKSPPTQTTKAENEPPKLTYSQQLKKQLARSNIKKKKGKR